MNASFKFLAILPICLFSVFPVFSQDISGTWYGLLEMHDLKIRTILHITKVGNGYEVTSDVPDMDFYNVKPDTIIYDKNKVIIKNEKYDIYYKGTLSPMGTFIEGIHKQHGDSVLLSYGKTPIAPPEKIYLQPIQDENLCEKYPGTYKLKNSELILIKCINYSLKIILDDGIEYEINPISNTKFSIEGNKQFRFIYFMFDDKENIKQLNFTKTITKTIELTATKQ